MESKMPGKAGVVGALVVILLVGGVYLLIRQGSGAVGSHKVPGWQTYNAGDFTLQYPDTYEFSKGDSASYPVGSLLVTEHQGRGGVPVIGNIHIDKTPYEGTNLADAWLTFSETSDTYFEECQTLFLADSVGTLSVPSEVNNVTWDEREGGWRGEAAAGTTFESRTFHTLHNNSCYEVSLHVATTNIGNYEPGTITEVDDEALKTELLSIFHTFHFSN